MDAQLATVFAYLDYVVAAQSFRKGETSAESLLATRAAFYSALEGIQEGAEFYLELLTDSEPELAALLTR